MVGHTMTFLDLRLFLRCELVKDISQMPTQLQLKSLSAALWDENNVIFAVPGREA